MDWKLSGGSYIVEWNGEQSQWDQQNYTFLRRIFYRKENGFPGKKI